MTVFRRTFTLLSVACALALVGPMGSLAAHDATSARATVAAVSAQDGTLTASSNGRGSGPVIYVYGQGLFYDSIVTADPLPPRGKFQELELGGPSSFGLQTQFGPGDQQYRGGRWWIDVNGDREMDEDDRYFSCPLLGPGRTDE